MEMFTDMHELEPPPLSSAVGSCWAERHLLPHIAGFGPAVDHGCCVYLNMIGA